MNTKDYVDLIKKHGDGYDGDRWQILAVNKAQSLFLVKDGNNICYVTTSDLVTTMMYSVVLAERMLAHYAGDSPIDEVARAVTDGKISPTKLVGIQLVKDDIAWLESKSIRDMVRSVESDD